MKIDLTGKTAVVTGSTAGMGYRIAEGLARAGSNIVIIGRKDQAVKDAVVRLRSTLPDIIVSGIVADVGTPEGVDKLVLAHPDADILINNSGIYSLMDFLAVSDEEWLRYFEINIMSGIRLTRAYLPGMLERYWGRILLVSSEWAVNIPPDMIPYGMTKAAILSITQGLSRRLKATGVTINAILPGPVEQSPETIEANKTTELCLTMEETIAAFGAQHASLGLAYSRAASSDEISELVVSLCSQGASGRNGMFVHVNGHVFADIMN